MVSFLEGIVKDLKEFNTVFSTGDYFKDEDSFIASGITDRQSALFYIRHINLANKFRVTNYTLNNQMFEESSDVRLVAQIPKDINVSAAMESLRYQLEDSIQNVIVSYTDDKYSIYKEETGKVLDANTSFNLIAITFRVNIEKWRSKNQCFPLCEKC